MTQRPWIAIALSACVVGCASTAPIDLAGIAEQQPLPYSVLVTGGSFVERSTGSAASDDLLAHTFVDTPDAEPVPLERIVEALRAGRVFNRVIGDGDALRTLRKKIAAMRGGLPLTDADARALLDRARRDGHDYVVVIQRIVDGPVDEYGINDRWPLTVSLWLLVGLGMFIPDHTFESRATLQASIFEVQTGRSVHRTVGGAGPTELALVGRGNAWSIVQSIIIPPFWVSDHDPTLREEMRLTTQARLVAALARQLKSATCRRDLEERALAVPEFVRLRDRDGVRIRAEQALGSVALRVDGVVVEGPAFDEFQRALIASARPDPAGGLVCEAPLPVLPEGRYLQILIRSVAGQVASVTIDRDPR